MDVRKVAMSRSRKTRRPLRGPQPDFSHRGKERRAAFSTVARDEGRKAGDDFHEHVDAS